MFDKGDMQLLQQFKENKGNNKEVCAMKWMKANDSTKLLQEVILTEERKNQW